MISGFLAPEFSERFGWMLVYAFLSGLLMLPAAVLVRFITHSLSAQFRYWCFLVVMLLTATLPCGVGYYSQRQPTDTTQPTEVSAFSQQATSRSVATVTARNPTTSLAHPNDQPTFAANHIRQLPAFWFFGALTTTLFVGLGFAGTRNLCRTSQQLYDSLKTRTALLQQQYPALQRIPVLINDRIASPILVGLIRPMILLPASAVGWDIETLRVVILHELAHARRWDNLINLLQRVVEALLFFQPAVWLISHWVRTEREVCCDQFVVYNTDRPKTYAQILLQFANQQTAQPSFLNASSMANRSVVYRISRLLKKDEPMKVSSLWLVVLIAVIGLVPLTVVNSVDADDQQKINTKPQSTAANAAVKTTVATEEPALVSATAATHNDVAHQVSVVATRPRIEIAREIDLKFAIGGILSRVKVQEGDRINKGQTLAELNQDLVQARFAELEVKANSTVIIKFAQHALTVAQANLEMATPHPELHSAAELRKLELDMVKTKAELDKAMEDRKLDELRLRTHLALMEQYHLESPVDGIVTRVTSTAGVSIEPSTVVLTVIDPTVLTATCFVPAKEIRKITRGMQVEFRLHQPLGLGLDPIHGSVLGFSSKSGANKDNSIEVRCELHNPHEHIRAGTYGELVFHSPVGATNQQNPQTEKTKF